MTDKKSGNVTQQMIAEKVGLDRRTVSQALSGRGGLAEATRQKILDAAREMGYRPNFTARAIRTGKQYRIGLITSRKRFSHLPQERLQGMQATAFANGYGLTLLMIPQQQIEDYKSLSEIVGGFGVDGVLLNYGKHNTDDITSILEQFNLPVVAVNNMLPYDCVYPDDFGISKRAVSLMLQSGLSPVVYVSYGNRKVSESDGGVMQLHFSENERMRGAIAAAEESQQDVIFCEVSELTERFLKGLPKVRGAKPGFICYNKLSLLRLNQALLESGMSVPDDAFLSYFALEALWDEQLDELFRPFLLPESRVGASAVQMLLRRIETGKKQKSIAVGAPEHMFEFALGNQPYHKFSWSKSD